MRTFAAVPAAARPATASSAKAPEVASSVAGTFFWEVFLAGLVASGVVVPGSCGLGAGAGSGSRVHLP